MKQTTEIAIRNLFGRRDDFVMSDEFVRFMEDVERKYAKGQNGQHDLRAECLPLWIEIAKLHDIPVEAPKELERRGPGRPKTKPEPVGT